jgi:2-polyprenyl-3-methyl-5-hydroxy-6-metoxy-1,4-benzoquinol methylase
VTGGCCAGIETVFGERTARRDLRHYRRRGPSKPTRLLLDALGAEGVEGATLLDIGGGVGAIQLELLASGAERATNVELSPAYEEEAAELLRDAGLADRVARRVVDFAAADDVESADVVLMHRVVCCYPDPKRLVGAAATHARRRLVLSYPPDNAVSRLIAALFNCWCSLRGIDFRAYVHPRTQILGAARAHGFEPRLDGRSGIWRVAALERVPSPG